MTRAQLEHVIRVAAGLTNANEITLNTPPPRPRNDRGAGRG